MNIDNINKTIAIMERAKEHDSLRMQFFQSSQEDDGTLTYARKIAETETDLHACGNTACLAGHIAVSEEWLSTPGNTICSPGRPISDPQKTPSAAIGEWWGVTSHTVDYFIYGFSTHKSTNGIYDVPWCQVKAEHVIRELKLLRDLGENKYRWSKDIPVPYSLL